MFMTEEKQNIQHTPFPPEEERRTEYVGAKVTPGQKRHIRRLADECGMTVSNYMLARAFGYRPKARLTARQEAVMETPYRLPERPSELHLRAPRHGPGEAQADVRQLPVHARVAQGTGQARRAHHGREP